MNEQQKAFVARFLGRGLLSKKKNKKITVAYEDYLGHEARFKTLATEIPKEVPAMQSLIRRLPAVLEHKNKGDFAAASLAMAELVQEAEILKVQVKYEHDLAGIQGELDAARLLATDGQPALETARQLLEQRRQAMQQRALAGDHAGAGALVPDVGEAARAFVALEAKYQRYKLALTGIQGDLDAAEQIAPDGQVALVAAQKQARTKREAMQKLATEGDFDGALGAVQGAGEAARALVALEAKYRPYKLALAGIQGDIDAARLIVPDGQAALTQAKQSFDQKRLAMLQLAQTGDYDGALGAVNGVGTAAKSAVTLETQYKSYKSELAKIQAGIDEAMNLSTEDMLPLETAKATFQQKHAALTPLLLKGDYLGAQALLQGVKDSAKAASDLRAKYDHCITAVLVTGGPDFAYLQKLANDAPPSGAIKDALFGYKDMMRKLYQGDYAGCEKDFKTLQGQIAAVKLALTESDKTAKPKALLAAKKVEDLAGGKKLSTLSDQEKAALVLELKKLPLKDQTDILADLHGSSEPVDAEGRLIQIALYQAMKLDENFEKEDAKKRKAYSEELAADTEIQDTVEDWNAVKDGKPVVSVAQQQAVLEKILKAQSKVYNIPVPVIRWYDGDAGDFGGFNTTSGIISLNNRYLSDPQEMINTVLHENTHNYQDQLVKRFFNGEIPESDPLYLQAKTFAVSHHMDAYVKGSEDGPAYKGQPEEMHAWGAGDTEAPKLLAALRQAKQDRETT